VRSGRSSRLWLLALLAAPAPLAAQPDEAAARFEEGVSHLQAQRYADAVGSFRASLRVREAAGTLYNLGLALRGLNRCREAAEALTRQAVIDANAERRAAGGQLLVEARACVAELSLTVRGRPDELLVDGVATPLGEGVHGLTLDPGTHHLQARREGYEPFAGRVELARGARVALLVDLSVARRGVISVETTAPAESIRVDGALLAPGRGEAEVPAGRHHVEVRFGAEATAQRREVEVPPGGRVTVSFAPPLARRVVAPASPASPPLYTRWWLWAGVGAAAVGVTLGVLAATGAFDTQAAPHAGSNAWGQVPFGLRSP